MCVLGLYMPNIQLILTGTFMLILAVGCISIPPSVSRMTCEKLAQHWTGEIAENTLGVETEVLAITDLSETSRVADEIESRLVCVGKAKFAGGTANWVDLRFFRDSNDDYWHEIQSRRAPPTGSVSTAQPAPTQAAPISTARPAPTQPAPTQTPDQFPGLKCADLIPWVTDIPTDDNAFIVEITMHEKISHDKNKLICKGSARFNDDDHWPIRFSGTRYKFYSWDPLPTSEMTCGLLVPATVKWSQEQYLTFAKIFDAGEVERTDDKLVCEGSVRINQRVSGIEFYVEETPQEGQSLSYDLTAPKAQATPTTSPQTQVTSTPVLPPASAPPRPTLTPKPPTPTPEPTSTPDPTPTPDPYVASSSGLRLLEWESSINEYEHVYISGVIENMSKTRSSEVGDACMYLDLFDAEGYFLEQLVISSIEPIPPGRKWKFSQLATTKKFDKIEFKAFKSCY